MKRLVRILVTISLMVGLVGVISCGGGTVTPPSGGTTPPPAPKTGEIEVHPLYASQAILVKGNGEPIRLIDNPLSRNVTYEALKDFLYNDITDENTYLIALITEDENDVDFICSDFAELLHNNAEASGLKAGLVYVELSGYSDHTMNVFETTDKGLIFIDSTGQSLIHAVAPPWMISFGDPESWDKVAYLRKDHVMGFIEISVAEQYGFTYEDYKKWQQDKADFDVLFDSYGDEITQEQERKLRRLANKLGGFFEQGEDNVISYQIFWEGNK